MASSNDQSPFTILRRPKDDTSDSPNKRSLAATKMAQRVNHDELTIDDKLNFLEESREDDKKDEDIDSVFHAVEPKDIAVKEAADGSTISIGLALKQSQSNSSKKHKVVVKKSATILDLYAHAKQLSAV